MRRFITSTNLARLALLAVLAFSLHQIDEMKPPSKTAWARHLAEGKDPTVAEHVQVGMWGGAVARATIAGALLLVSLAWSAKGAAPDEAPMQLGGASLHTRTFWIGVGVIVFGALAMRLPRMSQSFWGDEADAVASYVHGQYRPIKKKDPQGALFFEQPAWGQTLFSARHGPNNHVLFSLTSRACLVAWQKLTGRMEREFTEWPMRIPPLLAGLGSLATLACLLRRWGAPALGLLAAAFMALHPWHVRYSTEARGYALALCLLPLMLIVLTGALERRGWRQWLLFGFIEFLLMYAWPGAAYPLAFINLALLGIMLCRPDRWLQLGRWATANLLAAAVFISLYAPHIPQIKRYNETHVWMKGLPMDDVWLHNLLAFPFTGIPYHGPVTGNPAGVSWQRLLVESPVLTTAGFALILVALVAGLVLLWRRSTKIAALVTSVFFAAVVAAVHFKFFIGDELRAWYLIFTLPCLGICVAAGFWWMGGIVPRLRGGIVVALLALTTASVWPMNHSLMVYPSEDFKGVMAVTRDKHEIFMPKGRAEVFTCWLWRYAALYDPRGEIHVRNAADLKQRMEDAKAVKCGLFVVVGYRDLAMLQSADMLRVLDDPAFFEKTAVFPGYDSMHTLEVYRMKPVPLP